MKRIEDWVGTDIWRGVAVVEVYLLVVALLIFGAYLLGEHLRGGS